MAADPSPAPASPVHKLYIQSDLPLYAHFTTDGAPVFEFISRHFAHGTFAKLIGAQKIILVSLAFLARWEPEECSLITRVRPAKLLECSGQKKGITYLAIRALKERGLIDYAQKGTNFPSTYILPMPLKPDGDDWRCRPARDDSGAQSEFWEETSQQGGGATVQSSEHSARALLDTEPNPFTGTGLSARATEQCVQPIEQQAASARAIEQSARAIEQSVQWRARSAAGLSDVQYSTLLTKKYSTGAVAWQDTPTVSELLASITINEQKINKRGIAKLLLSPHCTLENTKRALRRVEEEIAIIMAKPNPNPIGYLYTLIRDGCGVTQTTEQRQIEKLPEHIQEEIAAGKAAQRQEEIAAEQKIDSAMQQIPDYELRTIVQALMRQWAGNGPVTANLANALREPAIARRNRLVRDEIWKRYFSMGRAYGAAKERGSH